MTGKSSMISWTGKSKFILWLIKKTLYLKKLTESSYIKLIYSFVWLTRKNTHNTKWDLIIFRNVEESNETSSNEFRTSFDSNQERLKKYVSQSTKKTIDFGNKIHSDLEDSRLLRESDLNQVKASCTDSLLKVLQVSVS